MLYAEGFLLVFEVHVHDRQHFYSMPFYGHFIMSKMCLQLVDQQIATNYEDDLCVD